MATNKKWFLGWTNIKKTITELVKIFSNAPSYFSKKRIESGIAFVVGQAGMIFYIIQKYQTMDMYEMGIWASIEFSITGWTIAQIQKEKKFLNGKVEDTKDNQDNIEQINS